MKRLKTIIVILSLSLSILNCNNGNPNIPTKPSEKSFLGKWKWIKTSGGYAYQEFFPPPAIHVVFNNFNICTFYRNDTILSERNILLTREKLYTADTQNIISFIDIRSDSTTDYIHFPGMGQKYYGIYNDTLFISDLGEDMFAYFYTKEK